MHRTAIVGAVLLVVGLLVGGYVADRAEAQDSFFGSGETWFLDPDRYVRIDKSTPYTVPPGQVPVVGAVGGSEARTTSSESAVRTSGR